MYLQSNELFGLIVNKNNLFSILGDEWPSHLDQLSNLKKYANDPKFQREFMEAKSQNKRKLAAYLTEKTGTYVLLKRLQLLEGGR